jgi:hypothetical protein
MRCLSLLIIAISTMIMLAWCFGLHDIPAFYSDGSTTKFTTAVMFFLSGIALYNFNIKCLSEAQVFSAFCTLFIIFFLVYEATVEGSVMLFKQITPHTGIENLPSLVTIISFFAFASACIFPKRAIIHNACGILFVCAGLSIIGHVLNIPVFYFYYNDVSNGMSTPTAILFIMMGIALDNEQRKFDTMLLNRKRNTAI